MRKGLTHMRFPLLVFPVLILSLCSAGSFQLTKKDVRRATDMMLKLHVEHKEFSPLMARRSIKIYLEQFDPDKIYFTAREALPFNDLKEERLKALVTNYLKDDLTEYSSLNQAIQGAIIRARKLRAQIAAQLIESEESFSLPKTMSYTDFAKNETELKERIKAHLAYLVNRERHYSNAQNWDKEQKRQTLELWERRFHRLEDPYLSTDRMAEHFLCMHTLKAVAKSLDAHTSYYSPEEAHDMRASLEKQFEGIGIILREGIEGIAIVGLVKGGPAERSGRVLVGDVIMAIDGKTVAGLSYEEILRRLQEVSRGQIQLELKRAKMDELVKVALAKEKILMKEDRLTYSAEPFADGIIGKLVLSSFYESGDGSSCEKDIREALRQLKKQGNLLGVVLDLRENSGGFLTQAVKVASLFLSSGIVVISKYSQGETHYLRNLDIHSYYNGPLVVLTSRASASAAEIVAQALQDYGTALVIGDERTYGKGTIQYQTVTDPNASCFFKVTVGRYYTVSGRTTQIDGVLADIIVPSHYSNVNIGERFLAYPLKSDRVPSVYTDPLSDIEQKNRAWFQQNYIPHLQKKISVWTRMIPALKSNTEECLSKNKDFALFMKVLEEQKSKEAPFYPTPLQNWGSEDLQMHQAVRILKDMVYLRSLL
jgi:carboxyl-terminal processing protease